MYFKRRVSIHMPAGYFTELNVMDFKSIFSLLSDYKSERAVIKEVF